MPAFAKTSAAHTGVHVDHGVLVVSVPDRTAEPFVAADAACGGCTEASFSTDDDADACLLWGALSAEGVAAFTEGTGLWADVLASEGGDGTVLTFLASLLALGGPGTVMGLRLVSRGNSGSSGTSRISVTKGLASIRMVWGVTPLSPL